MKRIFIIGIARSGSTLLQSILASHPKIQSFPETHFFSFLPKQKIFRFFSFISIKGNKVVEDYLSRNKLNKNNKYVPLFTFSKKKWVRKMVKILDSITIKNKKMIWVEKTPLHLYHTDLIKSVYQETFFIHILRNGQDNIASLFDASIKYPDTFKQKSIESCINRYKKEINISLANKNKENHFFVRFEDIVSNPKKTIENLIKQLNIEYHPDMINFQDNVSDIIEKNEYWKEGNYKEIQNKNNKFSEIFSIDEQNFINNKINNIDLNIFNYD